MPGNLSIRTGGGFLSRSPFVDFVDFADFADLMEPATDCGGFEIRRASPYVFARDGLRFGSFASGSVASTTLATKSGSRGSGFCDLRRS